MGRHSAPDDDEDAGLEAAAAPATSVATVPIGRHSRESPPRPRPARGRPHDDGPATEGLALIEDALGSFSTEHAPDAAGALLPGPDDRTTEIPLAAIARDDRPLPEKVTAQLAPVTDAEPTDAPPQVEPGTTAPRGTHATRHDLALVMEHGDVRARVLAAVLVPFVVYVTVLAIIGKLTVHSLIWVWAPAIAAGVLVGLVLDAGHRRYPAPSSDPA